jgi:hypothetical protein
MARRDIIKPMNECPVEVAIMSRTMADAFRLSGRPSVFREIEEDELQQWVSLSPEEQAKVPPDQRPMAFIR